MFLKLHPKGAHTKLPQQWTNGCTAIKTWIKSDNKKRQCLQIKLQLICRRCSYTSAKHKGEQPPTHVANIYVCTNVTIQWLRISRRATIFCRSVGLFVPFKFWPSDQRNNESSKLQNVIHIRQRTAKNSKEQQ